MQAKDVAWVSPNSVAHRQYIAIDSNDPRLSSLNFGRTIGSTGAQIIVVGGNGYALGNINLNGNSTIGAGNIGIDAQPRGAISPYINPYDPFLDPNAPSGRPKFFNLGAPTNLTATWQGDDLLLNFTYDTTVGYNSVTTNFVVEGLSSVATGSIDRTTSVSFTVNKSSSSQSILFTKAINTQTMGFFCVDFANISVYAVDSNGASGVAATVVPPTYTISLTTPSITVTSVNNGYSIAWTDPVSTQLTALDVWEIESTAGSAPAIIYAADGITPTNYNRVYEGKLNPIVIVSPNINKRWVVARFSSTSGIFTSFSSAVSVTPTSPVTVNTAPPTDVTSVTATWFNTNNIQINYTLPSTNAGVRFIAILTAPNGSSGYFYFFPDGTTNLNQTHTIQEAEIKAQFGTYYSQFTGVLKSASVTDAQSSGTSFTVPLRANPLANVTPNPTIIPIIDGYTVAFDTNTAAYGEVYEFYEDPTSFISTVHDYMDADWVSGGSAGSSSFVIQNFTDDMGMMMDGMPVMHIGYIITGTGIAPNTWVHSIDGSGPYTITLKTADENGNVIDSPLTAQASGRYHMQALVYSGSGPYTAFSSFFQQRYVDVFYYDLFAQRSLPSTVIPITPINPAIQFIAPNPPTITVASTSYSSITLNIVTADQSTNQYLLFYKKDTDTSYGATLVNTDTNFTGPGNTSTSVVTIDNLLPNTLYDFYAQGASYVNGIGIASSIVQGTTTGATVSTVSNIVLNAIAYGITANWTEASDTPTKIGKYKVDLYSGSNLLKTQYTYSTVTSFTGLTASTTYYVKIAAIDIYNESGASVTSSTLTLGSSGLATDGMPAPIANTPTITSLFNALEVTWTAVTNPDPITYEVHISTSSGFTASSTTKYLETPGTFAVIKTLPNGTPLSYSTTYYVVLVAKDYNGSSGQSSQASGTPSKIDNGDIATNAIRANVIQAGTITSNEINSSSLLVGKLFAVGNTTDSYAIKIDATSTTTKLYSGTGTYSDSATPFYLDTTGKFSLKDRLYFNGSNTLTVNGIINAQSGTFTGAVTAGNMKFGVNANSTNTGIYINTNNYWYDTGNFSVGATGNGITWDGTSFTVTGKLNANSGSTFGGTVTISGSGLLTSGTYTGGNLTTGYQLSTTGLLFKNNGSQTTLIDNTGFLQTNSANIGGWTVDSQRLQYFTGSTYTGLSTTSQSGSYAIYAGSTTSGGDTTAFAVTPAGKVYANNIVVSGGSLNISNNFVVDTSGNLTANGNITIGGNGSIGGNLSLSGSIYSKSVNPATSNGQGFILNQNGLRFNSATTNGITTIDGSSGLLTTTAASIGTWTVNTNQIYKTANYGSLYLNATNPVSMYVVDTTGNYSAGFLTQQGGNVTDAAIWAGNVSGPSTVSTGSPAFKVTYGGVLNALGANITGTITSTGQGSVTLDGPNDMIRVSTASGNKAYMFPAAGNSNFTGFYITADSGGTSPFTVSGSTYTLNPTNLNNIPFLGIGNTVNRYGTSMTGIGLYAQNSYMNVTQDNGIGLWTGDGTNLKTGIVLSKSIVSLGFNNNTTYNPQINGSTQLSGSVNPTSAGSNTLNIDQYKLLATAANGVQLQIVGSASDPSGAVQGINLLSNFTAGPQINVSSTGINISANVPTNTYYYYASGSQIYTSGLQYLKFGTSGIKMSSPNPYGDLYTTLPSTANFVRFLAAAPLDVSYAGISAGEVVRGPAIYNAPASLTPSSSSGYVGDLWVAY